MDTYLVCATPRTGSSLLCGLLDSTGVAGHPESYFRAPDEPAWAARWGITGPDGAFDYADYVRSALVAGRSENGVFAARVMWGTLREVVTKLESTGGEHTGGDLAALQRAFGSTKFVYLWRDDVVAQAVSWLRAEQTQIWQESTQAERHAPAPRPHFDHERIDGYCRVIVEHNAAWRLWFDTVGVEPCAVRYEDLDADPAGTARRVLDDLGIGVPSGLRIQARHRRLADDLNAQWIDRFRTAVDSGPATPSGRGA